MQTTRQGKSAQRAFSFDIEFHTIERERRRVAKELHDEILPLMARLTRYLQAQPELSQDPKCDALIERVHQTVSDLRDLLGELHPVDLEELGLVAALSNICNRHTRLTNLCLLFVERVEEFELGEQEQLCLYRALQAVLKMFANSTNDILVITCDRMLSTNFITVRCVDKRVSSDFWLSAAQPEFSAFEAWCEMSGAKVEIEAGNYGEFPCDLIISFPNSSTKHSRLSKGNAISLGDLGRKKNSLHALGTQNERESGWHPTNASLYEKLALTAERQKIGEDLTRLIIPRFQEIKQLAMELTYTNPYVIDFMMRLQTIESGINGISSELHPGLLSEHGFLPSIRTLVECFQRESGVATNLEIRTGVSDTELGIEAKFAIYRTIQESLNNIEKHAEASQARVILQRLEQSLIIQIEDNGKGISAETGFRQKANSQSRGLKNIRARAAAISATVSWESSKSFASGTCVTIRLG